MFREPLAVRLAGLNVLVVLAGTTAMYFFGLVTGNSGNVLLLIVVVMAAGFALNSLLVNAAMRPLRALEEAAHVRLRELAADVIRVGDRERADLTRKVQTSTEYALSSLIAQLRTAMHASRDTALTHRLESMHTIATAVLQDVRSIVHTAVPRQVHETGLFAALESMASAINAWSIVSVEVRLADGTPDRVQAIPSHIAVALSRVAQEAVHNALKHAEARHVIISLEVSHTDAVLRVADDGIGFEIARIIRTRSDSDLLMLQERVTLIGGTFEITSIPNQGTYLCASVPLRSSTHIAVI